MRRSTSFGAARRSSGSEIELAPNRKPYLPDEQLEGPKLDRTLTIALHHAVRDRDRAAACTGSSSPAGRPARRRDFRETFEERGAAMFAPVGTSLDALGLRRVSRAEGRRWHHELQPPRARRQREGRQLAGPRAQHRRCCGSRVKRSRTSSRTGARSPRCRHGVSPAVVRSTTSRSRTSSTISQSIQISPDEAQQQAKDELGEDDG